MITDDDRIAVTTFIQSWWNKTTMGPIAWPNAAFTIPSNSHWATVEFVELDSYRASLGRDNFLLRTEGIVQIDLYAPSDDGTGKSRRYAELIHNKFLDLDLLSSPETLVFGVPVVSSPASNEVRAANLEDNWYRLTVNCRFRKDSTIDK